MAQVYRRREYRPAMSKAQRPLMTMRSDYQQTNMPLVLLTILMLAMMGVLMVGILFFNLADFA